MATDRAPMDVSPKQLLNTLGAHALSILDPVAGLLPGGHWLSDPAFTEVAGTSGTCYLAVGAGQGPHVTPTAFIISGGRIWLITERSSVKSKVLSKRPRASILIRSGQSSVLVEGVARVLGPLSALMPQHALDTALAGPALMRYLIGNRARLGGYLSDPLKNIALLNPFERVLIALTPTSMLGLEGARVIERRGVVPESDPLPSSPLGGKEGAALDLDLAPATIADLSEAKRTPAVLAWEGPSGPLAIPAHWHGERNLASVPSVLLQGAAEGRAALCLEAEKGRDLKDQQGLLARGHGRVMGVRGDYAAIAIESDRTVVWSGTETQSGSQ